MTRFFGFSIFTPKISDDPFLVIDQVFPFLFPDLPYLCYVKCRRPIYDPFGHSSQENTFFTLFILSRASDVTLLLKISGRRMHVPSPISNFWGRGVYPPKTSGANSPQSHRPSLFYGVRFQSMGKLQAPKARNSDSRTQKDPST